MANRGVPNRVTITIILLSSSGRSKRYVVATVLTNSFESNRITSRTFGVRPTSVHGYLAGGGSMIHEMNLNQMQDAQPWIGSLPFWIFMRVFCVLCGLEFDTSHLTIYMFYALVVIIFFIEFDTYTAWGS